MFHAQRRHHFSAMGEDHPADGARCQQKGEGEYKSCQKCDHERATFPFHLDVHFMFLSFRHVNTPFSLASRPVSRYAPQPFHMGFAHTGAGLMSGY
jgi:hypothetical protein